MTLQEPLASTVNRCYEKALASQQNVAKAVKFNNLDHILFVDCARRGGQRPVLINMKDYMHPKPENIPTPLKMKETITRWDFLSTLKPPENLSIESGNIYHIEKLGEGSPDYDFVAKMFLSTFNG
jgi:hypothetical protein